ncbi:MAG TPA: Rieske (2Fe-2S) protein [Chroococcidiopsis sp.]
MDRRTFVVLAGLGALVSSLEAIANARTPSPVTDPTLVAQAAGFQTVGTVSQLNSAHVIQTRIGRTSVAVIRNPSNPNGVLAFNRRCPHEGCQVDWSNNQSQFVCPCHSAEFSATGQAVRGPARSPLTHYPARIQGGQVQVQII